MGLLKWLKREMQNTPPSSESDNGAGSKVHILRNDSYLRALTKFNKWRQVHMALNPTKQKQTQPQSIQSSPTIINSSFSNRTYDCPQMIYEEVLFSPQGSNSFDESMQSGVTSCDIEDAYENDGVSGSPTAVRGTPSGLHYSNQTNMNSYECFSDDDAESHYAIPFKNCNIASSATIFQNYIDENFEFLNTDELRSSKANLIVTDLDQSENYTKASHLISKNHTPNETQSEDIFYPSDLMRCPLVLLETEAKNIGFPNSNSNGIYHGEVGSIQISFIKPKEDDQEAAQNNFETLRILRHPNILLLMGVSLRENMHLEALLFEPIECSLNDRIHLEKVPIPLPSCHQYILHITNAVIYLHQRKIVHSNISSQNIVLCNSGETAKLMGFDLSVKINSKTDFKNNKLEAQSIFQLSPKKRCLYTKYNYQAPELLACEDQTFIMPTEQSDIYGICITLWEVINNTIPYQQFTLNELLKVFSLENAQPPIYEETRHRPYAALLEKGLKIQVAHRLPSAIALKKALNRINLSSSVNNGETPIGPDIDDVSFNLNDYKSPNAITPITECRDERRTSTTEKAKQELNLTNFMENRVSCFPEHYSPIAEGGNFDMPYQVAEEDSDIESKSSNNTFHDENLYIPSKRFSVSIRISSRNCSTTWKDNSTNLHPSSSLFDSEIESNKTHSIREKIEKFENLGHSYSASYWKNENFEPKLINTCKTSSASSSTQRIGFKPMQALAPTEDFYIDDDFPHDCNLGVNLELRQNNP